MSSSSDDGAPEWIPAEMMRRLEANDPQAWLEFLQKVHASARAAIQAALTEDASNAPRAAKRLLNAYRRDEEEVHLALDLAWTSFQGRFLKKQWSADQIQTEADCAACLIGVAYNRWQRLRYRDRQIGRQTGLGSYRGADDDGTSLLDQHPDPGPGPEEDVDLNDFLKVMEQVLEEFTRPFNEEDRRVIFLHYYEKKNPSEIHRLLGVKLARCQDLIRLWRVHLTQRFPNTLDFRDLQNGPTDVE